MSEAEGGSRGGEARVAREHEHVATLLESLGRACRAAALDTARSCGSRLEEGLEAHLQREERLYFPPLAVLRPEQRAALARLVAAHGELRSRLAALLAGLVSGDLEAVREGLERLGAEFARHEAEEEALLDALDTELARIG